MKKLLVGAALAVSMLAAAPAANAATAITLPAPAADGTLSYGYTQALPAPGGLFSYEYTFNYPSAGLASTFLTSITLKAGSGTDVNFTSVLLNGQAFDLTGGLKEQATLAGYPVDTSAQTLVVNGWSGGNAQYTIDFAFAAVPEPATWAMMIIGFGGAGVAIRRRRRDDSVAFA